KSGGRVVEHLQIETWTERSPPERITPPSRRRFHSLRFRYGELDSRRHAQTGVQIQAHRKSSTCSP
ncbi:hypothetical protein KI387_002811, partial [Taxus chinensis]